MRILVKSQDFLVKCLGFVLLFGFISLGAIGGCNNNGGEGDSTRARTENDFFNDPSLTANPEKDTVVMFLEPSDALPEDNQTSELGNDVYTLRYKRTVSHTFCWEDENPEAGHFMELDDSEGNLVLRLDVNGECVTEVIETGDYVVTLVHDGLSNTNHPIFIVPDPDDIQDARDTDGLINGFKVASARVLKHIQNAVTEDSRAQTVQDNINTLLTTNFCKECDLEGANLEGANLGGGELTGADLRSADLTGASLDFALWCGGVCRCATPSIGTCVGCPSVGDVCTGF